MGVGALISGYLAYEDAMEAIDNYVHGQDKFGNPYGATDLTLDLGGELAEIVIGATIAGAGWKVQKITRQAISRWWRKSDDIAKKLVKPSSFASINVLNNLTLTQLVTIGTLTHIISETPESVYDIYKAYQSGNITWEDVENRAIEELYGVLIGLGFAAGFALVGKAGSIAKPYFVD